MQTKQIYEITQACDEYPITVSGHDNNLGQFIKITVLSDNRIAARDRIRDRLTEGGVPHFFNNTKKLSSIGHLEFKAVSD